MTWSARQFLLMFALACIAGEASAQWWVGGDSYSLRVDKYDSFYGEARPTRWSVERPPGVHWKHMLAHKREIHARMYEASGGYPAVFRAAYPAPYYAAVPEGAAPFYVYGYPTGFPVDDAIHRSQMFTWRPRVVQVDPLPGDRDESIPYPADDLPPPIPLVPADTPPLEPPLP